MPFTGAENTVYQYTKAIAELAYIYGYAVISLWILMSVDVNTKAPFNQMYYYDSLPTPTNSPYRGPNADTIYATAWIDLSNTPISLATPDTRQQNRWYTVQLLDIFGNTFANLPGSEKNRPAQNYFLVGPSWTTDEYVVPGNSFLINAPSNIVYLVARVSVKDNDVTSAANVLNQITLQTVINNAPVLQVTQVNNSLYSTVDFFTLLMQVLNYNQQSIDDVVDSLFLSIGLNPDTYFSPTSLPAYTLQGYTDAVDVAFNQIIPNGYKYASGLVFTSSWQGGTKNGLYGNDFVRRAYSYYSGPAANVPDEQYYMTTNQDSTFALLNGTLHNYKMHFPAFSYPAVNSKWGFWSLTVYTPTLELYSNSINRYALGTNNHNLVYNGDGSLDIFIQNTQPTGTDPNLANWIPCPSGPFRLILRMYSPTQTQILSPTNVPPVLVN